MKGRKCSIIFMRKVANRLAVLEERYKALSPKERARKINDEMLNVFCVGEREIQQWKRIVNLTKQHDEHMFAEMAIQVPSSHLREIARLPEEKQEEVLDQVINNKMSFQATALLVQQTLGIAFKPQIYNVWNFAGCDEKYGVQDYPGRIPGQIVENVLYYFTNEGDLIVDPMAGSGTTLDVCKNLKRQCLAYDMKPSRDDIKPHDIKQGFPEETKNCKLIFLDPPYFNMVYKDLFIDIHNFYDFLHKLAQDCFDTIAEDGYVAFLMQDMTELGNYCLSGSGYCIFFSHGFKCVAHISVPLTTENFLPQQVEKAKREKRMLGRNRDLYIFKKHEGIQHG